MPETASAVPASGGQPVAAIDCGTNSTRLLVADSHGRTLDRRMRITRLGEAVDRTGRLQPAAIERTLAVLADYGEAMVAACVGARMAAATSALRDASNAEEFLGRAGELLGTRPRVLAGSEEGGLSYRGATAELPVSAGPYLVVDVGGGSTELVTPAAGGSIEAISLDIGCVRVTERFLASDPPTPAELAEASRVVTELLSEARAEHPAFGRAAALVGLAGTVSALTMLSLELESYDRSAVHHARLSRDEVARLLEVLASRDVARRRALRGMEHDRADVIVGGAVVLLSVMDTFAFAELIVSESDILDGMVAELLDS